MVRRPQLDLGPLLALRVAIVLADGADRIWRGSPDELLARLDVRTSPLLRALPGWPTTGRALATALERAAQQLRLRGIIYRRSALGDRPITLTRMVV